VGPLIRLAGLFRQKSRPKRRRNVHGKGKFQRFPVSGSENTDFTALIFVENQMGAFRMETSGSFSPALLIKALGKRAVLIGMVAVACLAAVVADASAASPNEPGQARSEAALIVMSAPLADGQQLTVIDPATRVVCIYHVSAKTGEISLKSVRNITWDLRMTQFNGVNPLPEEIRSLVEQR